MHKPDRIMVLGDSHGNFPFVAQALRLARKHGCQGLHVVGDFGIWTHVEAGVRFLDDVDELARNFGIVVTFTDGNHENFDYLYGISLDGDGWRRVRPNIWHAPRGHIWRWGDANFMSMGGAHSINGPGGPSWWKLKRIGPLDRDLTYDRQDENGFVESITIPKGTDLGDWWPQETITDEDVRTAIQNMIDWANGFNPHPEIDVLFTHDAPSRISLPARFGDYPAADENRARLQQVYEVAQPKVLVHGHYHFHQQYQDYALNCLAVSLAHDGSQNDGQYMFIDTDASKESFGAIVPDFQGARA